MKHNFRTPHLLLALALAVGIVSLVPASGGSFSQASLTRGLLAEETTSSENTVQPENTVPATNVPCDSTTGANCEPATTDNYNQQPMQPKPMDPTQTQPQQPQPMQPMDNGGMSGGGGGCAQGTICDNNGGGMNGGMNMGTNPSEKDCQFDVRDAKRMYNEISHWIKRKTKEGADISRLTEILAIVEGAKTKLESCSSLTWDELSSVRQSLMGEMGQGGVNMEINQLRCWDDYARQLKDNDRMKKDSERTKTDLENMSVGDMADEVDAQMERMDRMLELNEQILSLMKDNDCNIWNNSDSTVQFDMENKRYEMDELRMEMDDFWPKLEEIRTKGWAGQMFDQVEKDIANAKETEYANMPPAMQEKFNAVSQVALNLVSEGRKCLSSGDMECVKDKQWRLEQLGRKADQIFGKQEVDFEKMGFDKSMNTKFEQVAGDGNYGEEIQMIKSLIESDPTLIDKIMERDPKMANKILKMMGKMSGENQSKYLSQQGELKDTLDEAIATAPQLKTYKDEILSANFMGDGLTEMNTTLEDIRDGKEQFQSTEFVQTMDQLKTTSRNQEVELGVSKFQDATTDTWYHDVTEDDAISGKMINGQATFDPSGQTTYAEMLKVIAEATGIGQSDGDTSYGAAQNHWSKGYFKAVEGRGVTFINPDQTITRGEMARLVVEITGIPMQDVQTPFVDLAGNKYESYIKTLYANGVVNGNPDGTVKPNDSINRAEAFTLVKNMIDNLGLMAVDVKSIQEIETMKMDMDTDVIMDMKDDGNYIKEDQGGGGSYGDDNYDNEPENTLKDMDKMMDWE